MPLYRPAHLQLPSLVGLCCCRLLSSFGDAAAHCIAMRYHKTTLKCERQQLQGGGGRSYDTCYAWKEATTYRQWVCSNVRPPCRWSGQSY